MMINAQISRQTTIKSTNTAIGCTIIDNSNEFRINSNRTPLALYFQHTLQMK